MHNTYFEAVYDSCHVLFLVYLSCEMGDNRGVWNSNSLSGVLTCFTMVHLFAIAGLWPPLNNYFVFGIGFTSLYFVLNFRDENLGGGYIDFMVTLSCKY